MDATVTWIGIVDATFGALMLSRVWTVEGNTEDPRSGSALGMALLEHSRTAWETAKVETQVAEYSYLGRTVTLLVKAVADVIFIVGGEGDMPEIEQHTVVPLLDTITKVCEEATEHKLSPDALRSSAARVAVCIDEMVNQGCIQLLDMQLLLPIAKGKR